MEGALGSKNGSIYHGEVGTHAIGNFFDTDKLTDLAADTHYCVGHDITHYKGPFTPARVGALESIRDPWWLVQQHREAHTWKR